MATKTSVIAPGARILVRDAEWLVRRVDRTSTNGQALTVVGISEIVKNKESIFLTEIDSRIEVMDPVDTKLVQDTSHSYQASLLYIESLLRKTPPTDEALYIGHRAAMDVVPYQLKPALQALNQPRQRILIADAVGLGKTLEAGILISELIRRGRGRRILVLAIKSMLTQFQKEMWCRFTIPLVRLDSIGIQRIRSHIPTNHNPFYYYDKAIISIDTLKQDSEYRSYLEKAYWDIIVIDEAQNVAERGSSSSMRAKLAKLLAGRSDTLIMLSATPHDGKARSFASLMNMLDPTAIADPDDYGPEDIKGLFIRRFKKDIKDQVEKAFKERTISIARCQASPTEESAFNTLTKLQFTQIDQQRTAGMLFKTTLEKALFSSPAACLETVGNRIKTLRKKNEPGLENDVQSLEELAEVVRRISPEEFNKYEKLLKVISDPAQGFGWNGRDPLDRLVIFTERIETLRFLKEHLTRDLHLDEAQVKTLYGTMSDVEQQEIVEDFGRDEASVRLLIASDVASEGINLHYLCHRMIHFDIPWSLMVFQQRNGRIDRYGQEKAPEIVYLVTESAHEKINGDTRILELLIKKDDEAVRNIGDPSTFMGVYDIEEEEKITAAAIERGATAEEFDASLVVSTFDPLALLMGEESASNGKAEEMSTKSMPSLFRDDYSYFENALKFLCQFEPLQIETYPAERRIELTATPDLRQLFRAIPGEVWPEDSVFVLSADVEVIQKEIKRSRKEESAWPKIHYLWEMNPLMEWLNDRMVSHFRRHEAPVITLEENLQKGEIVFLVSGLIPNMKGHPLIHCWFGLVFSGKRFQGAEELESIVHRTGLGRHSPANRCPTFDMDFLKTLLPEVVKKAQEYMSEKRRAFERAINEKLQKHLDALEELKKKKYEYLKLRCDKSRQAEKVVRERIEKEQRSTDELFDEYYEWIEETMTTEDNPFIQIIAVVKGV